MIRASRYLASAWLLGAMLVAGPANALTPDEDACNALLSRVGQQTSVEAQCGLVDEVRRRCGGADGSELMQQILRQLEGICQAQRGMQRDDAAKRVVPAPVATPSPARPATRPSSTTAAPPAPVVGVSRPTPAAMAANRAAVLANASQRLQQSLTRIKLLTGDVQALIATAQQFAEDYVERRAGSVLEYSSKDDDALADSRGFRKRESENFVVFYRTGDMVRAQTLLGDAEASMAPVKAILGAFPLPKDHRGRKLPIYLANSHEAYQTLSKCPDQSDACINHLFFDDGVVQTAYFSPKSYQVGAKAADRIAYFQAVIQHELTHYAQFDMVTRATAGSMPSWLVEGLASYVGGQTLRIEQLVERSKNGSRLLSMSQLGAIRGDIFKSTDVSLIYAEGYTVFETLVRRKGVEATKALVIDVTQNEPFENALGTILAMSPREFDDLWRNDQLATNGLVIPESAGLSVSVLAPLNGATSKPADARIEIASGAQASADRWVTAGPTQMVRRGVRQVDRSSVARTSGGKVSYSSRSKFDAPDIRGNDEAVFHVSADCDSLSRNEEGRNAELVRTFPGTVDRQEVETACRLADSAGTTGANAAPAEAAVAPTDSRVDALVSRINGLMSAHPIDANVGQRCGTAEEQVVVEYGRLSLQGVDKECSPFTIFVDVQLLAGQVRSVGQSGSAVLRPLLMCSGGANCVTYSDNDRSASNVLLLTSASSADQRTLDDLLEQLIASLRNSAGLSLRTQPPTPMPSGESVRASTSPTWRAVSDRAGAREIDSSSVIRTGASVMFLVRQPSGQVAKVSADCKTFERKEVVDGGTWSAWSTPFFGTDAHSEIELACR